MTLQTNPDLAWIVEAKKHVGLREVKGIKHNPTIISWLNELGAWWKDDETAWCGVFVAHCLHAAGLKRGKVNSRSKAYVKGDKAGSNHYPFNWYGAGEYRIEGGNKLSTPCYGCVAVKARKGGNHVTFVVGQTSDGRLVCLGGNQSDAVTYAIYRKSEFDSFMWYGKTANPAPHRFDLPIIVNVSSTKVTES